jgi:hypothetical protein
MDLYTATRVSDLTQPPVWPFAPPLGDYFFGIRPNAHHAQYQSLIKALSSYRDDWYHHQEDMDGSAGDSPLSDTELTPYAKNLIDVIMRQICESFLKYNRDVSSNSVQSALLELKVMAQRNYEDRQCQVVLESKILGEARRQLEGDPHPVWIHPGDFLRDVPPTDIVRTYSKWWRRFQNHCRELSQWMHRHRTILPAWREQQEIQRDDFYQLLARYRFSHPAVDRHEHVRLLDVQQRVEPCITVESESEHVDSDDDTCDLVAEDR